MADCGLESVVVVPPSFPGLAFSVAAFLAAKGAAAFDAANAARAAVTAVDAAGPVADAAANGGKTTAGCADFCATAGDEADNGGAALLAGDMAAAGSGAGLEPESSLNDTPTTASKAAPAISHRAFLGAAAGAD